MSRESANRTIAFVISAAMLMAGFLMGLLAVRQGYQGSWANALAGLIIAFGMMVWGSFGLRKFVSSNRNEP